MVQVLKNIPSFHHPWADERTGPLDDAAVLRPEPGRSLVFTIDVITPIVDDPRAFGGIAAANALSDVWAMGGRPEVALGFAGVPTDKVSLEVLGEILRGMQETCARANCGIVGGHTIADSEPKCGLAVVGSVDPARVWSHRSARPGDALILTKAIGTGIVAQAIRAGRADEAMIAAATAQMLALNGPACEAGLASGATSCTDVTGFGLLGHLRNLVEAAGVRATLRASAVPLMEGVLPFVEEGVVPGGTKRNLAYAAPVTEMAAEVSEAMRLLLADAQTSGGLLLCVPGDRAEEALGRLRDAGCARAALVGELFHAAPGGGGDQESAARIRVEV